MNFKSHSDQVHAILVNEQKSSLSGHLSGAPVGVEPGSQVGQVSWLERERERESFIACKLCKTAPAPAERLRLGQEGSRRGRKEAKFIVKFNSRAGRLARASTSGRARVGLPSRSRSSRLTGECRATSGQVNARACKPMCLWPAGWPASMDSGRPQGSRRAERLVYQPGSSDLPSPHANQQTIRIMCEWIRFPPAKGAGASSLVSSARQARSCVDSFVIHSLKPSTDAMALPSSSSSSSSLAHFHALPR